jgi:capsular exopolysaccharide synthesis family protein
MMPPNPGDSSPGPVHGSGPGGAGGGVPRFLVFLRKYWWLPLLTFLLGSGIGAGLLLWTPPVYVSSAAMWETERLHLTGGELFTEDASTYIGTQIELLKSGRMAQTTQETLRSTNGIPVGKDGLPMRVLLSFKEAPRTTVFVITASSADPSLSQNYLNTLMNGYLHYKADVRKLVSGETAASIEKQVESVETDLKADQDALAQFQRTNNLAILQEEGNVAGAHLEGLQTRLSDLQLKMQLLQATDLDRKTNSPEPEPGMRESIELAGNSGLAGASAGPGAQLTPYQEVARLKMQREKLSKYLRPKHPKIVALDAQIAESEQLIEMFRHQDHDQLLASERAVGLEMDAVSASIKEWKSTVTESSSRIAEAERLRQNVERSKSQKDRLSIMLENLDISRNTDLETLQILEPASVAKRTYPQITTAGMLAFAGLALGLGLVFVVEKRDDRFTCVTDVSSTIGDAVVGQLPEQRNGKKPVRLLELDDSRHSYAESYRNLRSALIFLTSESERPKLLLITSAMPGEGKSTVAANLARTLALSGSRVLLVDADLRKGSLHESLHLKGEPGLAELLRHTCEGDRVIQRESLPNFAFVSCGSHSGNPGDLFLGSGLDAVLAQWRREFDYVIIDSCPVFAARRP